ncbi:MAG TPA: hypothetical protein VK973_10860 [Arenicellales bacterium]|nr:hypothetical protein [Arenicellales bacterium]
MVIDNLNPISMAIRPDEADPPLLVYKDTVLTRSPAFERFQPVSRRNTQIVQACGVVQHSQFTPRRSLDISGQPPGRLPAPNPFGFTVSEATDHDLL